MRMKVWREGVLMMLRKGKRGGYKEVGEDIMGVQGERERGKREGGGKFARLSPSPFDH